MLIGGTQEPVDDTISAAVVEAFFDQTTNTISYVAFDAQRRVCAVIDSVLDFDYASGRISFESADKIIAYIHANDLTLEWIIETHVHADHLSAAPYIQNELGGKVGSGKYSIQTFGKVFNEGTDSSETVANLISCSQTKWISCRRYSEQSHAHTWAYASLRPFNR